MVRVSRYSAFIAALVLSLAIVGQAFAAESPWQSIDVISHNEGSQSILLVTGTLPEGTSLPAEVSLSVPQGAQIQWAGEILGGDPSADPEVQTQKSSVDGADVYAFTLTKAPMGQVEVIMPPAAFDGQSTYTTSIEWVSNQDVPKVEVSARIPSGSTVTQAAEGAKTLPGPDGYSYYTKSFTDVKPGDKLSLAVAYTAPAAAPIGAGATAPASSSPVPIIIALMVVVIGAALFAVGISRKMAAKRALAAGDYDDTDTDDAIEPQPASASLADESSADENDEAVEPAASKRLSPVALMTVALALVVVIAVVVVGQTTKPTQVDGTITKAYGGVGACTTAALALKPADGVDLARDGDKLIGALNGIESVGLVTLYPAESRMTVEYCDSSTDEGTIKNALASTGLVSW
jgi:hypothetical protein